MWSKLWIDIFVLMMFLRKEDFPCPFLLSKMEGSLHDPWTFRRRGDDEFLAVELQMPRSWMGEYFSPFFFGAIDGNVLQS